MIYLTRLNNKEFTINPDLIETAEATPDTVITLTTEKKYVVKESIDELIERIAEFRRRCHPEFRGGTRGNEN
ncbi:Flagellar protein FlbD [Dehalobacter sp. UNSWDHB]|uniref:flagellar FlbD family protein n=1 Tax=unclassified Dehalobacter TaxID=2635733 RepID=UPI00028A9AF7|nr:MULTISPECIES: flagellar FlbD family protein [unclassified Dehalobacter]AFV02559.1 Flagellar protein FlbD [Dehalobacter sp. DCA]AFV05547.1 Flagellar protein FlbD [Dehalobacter sp. CF]EQB19817.1 Flagellar protein FlbD [Dehalobacter sp. UNSWDHB]